MFMHLSMLFVAGIRPGIRRAVAGHQVGCMLFLLVSYYLTWSQVHGIRHGVLYETGLWQSAMPHQLTSKMTPCQVTSCKSTELRQNVQIHFNEKQRWYYLSDGPDAIGATVVQKR